VMWARLRESKQVNLHLWEGANSQGRARRAALRCPGKRAAAHLRDPTDPRRRARAARLLQ